jgi:hypothetical protein
MPKIIGILTRHYSKRDLNGNVYDYATYVETDTGRKVDIAGDNLAHMGPLLEENAYRREFNKESTYAFEAGKYFRVFHVEQETTKMELNKSLAKLKWQGDYDKCAQYIISQLFE